jgi:hypothetical protein
MHQRGDVVRTSRVFRRTLAFALEQQQIEIDDCVLDLRDRATPRGEVDERAAGSGCRRRHRQAA